MKECGEGSGSNRVRSSLHAPPRGGGGVKKGPTVNRRVNMNFVFDFPEENAQVFFVFNFPSNLSVPISTLKMVFPIFHNNRNS